MATKEAATMTTKEAAKALKIGLDHVYRLYSWGKLTGKKKGKAHSSPVLIDVASVAAYKKSMRKRGRRKSARISLPNKKMIVSGHETSTDETSEPANGTKDVGERRLTGKIMYVVSGVSEGIFDKTEAFDYIERLVHQALSCAAEGRANAVDSN